MEGTNREKKKITKHNPETDGGKRSRHPFVGNRGERRDEDLPFYGPKTIKREGAQKQNKKTRRLYKQNMS